MSIYANDIEKIAHLSRLAIYEHEIPVYAQTLDRIFHLFDQLDQIDVTHLTPMSHSLDCSQPLRKDEPVELSSEDIKDIQKIAPKVEANLYLVPPVIE